MVGRQALFILGLAAGLLLPGISSGWLEEGSANYGEVASWFSDPIFYSGPNRGGHEEYYPYFGKTFFQDPVLPLRLGIGGGLPLNWSQSASHSSRPTESLFRNRSLANLQWKSFSKNWTSTMDFAKNKSSLRVFKGREWGSV
jgi:hypothetical protein